MKFNTKLLMALAWVVFCLNAAGCMTLPKNYSSEAKAISPELGSTPLKYYKVIDTLQPELSWKDVKKEGETYDVCVWETKSHLQDESWWGVPLVPKKWGEQVDYVEGISENHYKVSKPLKPDTVYHWSVRIRKGEETSEWASFSQGMIGVLVMGYETHVAYGFITPKEETQAHQQTQPAGE